MEKNKLEGDVIWKDRPGADFKVKQTERRQRNYLNRVEV